MQQDWRLHNFCSELLVSAFLSVCPFCCRSTEYCTSYRSLPSPPATVAHQWRCPYLNTFDVSQSDWPRTASMYYICHYK